MNIKEKAVEVSGSVLKKMVEKEKQGNSKCCAILHQPKKTNSFKKKRKVSLIIEKNSNVL